MRAPTLYMKKNFAAILAIAALGLLLSACGQSALARNHTMAAAVLQRAGGGGIFADASDETRAAIRHAPSGMICELPSDGAFDMEAFPPSAANPGAYCSSVINGVATTLVAVHFDAGTTLDAAFSEALAASAGQAAPRSWPGEPSAADKAPPEGLPHFRIARFEAQIDGEARYLRVAMSEARGWYLQQIVSAPLAQAEAVEAQAGRDWRRLLPAFRDAPAGH